MGLKDSIKVEVKRAKNGFWHKLKNLRIIFISLEPDKRYLLLINQGKILIKGQKNA
jgi:hypothetical protein